MLNTVNHSQPSTIRVLGGAGSNPRMIYVNIPNSSWPPGHPSPCRQWCPVWGWCLRDPGMRAQPMLRREQSLLLGRGRLRSEFNWWCLWYKSCVVPSDFLSVQQVCLVFWNFGDPERVLKRVQNESRDVPRWPFVHPDPISEYGLLWYHCLFNASGISHLRPSITW